MCKNRNNMKTIKTLLISVSALVLTTSAAFAQQSTSTGYFLDNYSFNYRFNPSIQSDRSFFSLGLGNITVSEGTNIGVGTLLYPNPDGSGNLVTAFNKGVSSDLFASKLKNVNTFLLNEDVNILSFGVRKKNAMFNFEINLRATENILLPKDLFLFAKRGGMDMTYDMSALNVNANSVIEVAAGYSHRIDKLVIGARLKFLYGLVSANAYADKFYVKANSEKVEVLSDMNVDLACNVVKIPVNNEGNIDMSGFSPDFKALTSPAGVGGAIDLGVTYDFTDCLSATIGINDLGLTQWHYMSHAHAAGGAQFTGVNDIDIFAGENMGSSIQEELDKTLEDLQSLVDFNINEEPVSKLELLPFTVNAGIRYAMPFYKKLSVRGAFTYQTNTKFHFLDGRVGFTILPVNWFCLTANIGYNSYGATWGGGLSINAGILNLHAGFESYIGEMTKQWYLPLGGSKELATIGLSITIGRSQNAFATPKKQKKSKE